LLLSALLSSLFSPLRPLKSPDKLASKFLDLSYTYTHINKLAYVFGDDMNKLTIALFCAGMISMSACAADSSVTQSATPSATRASTNTSTATSVNAASQATAEATGTAAGIDTALAASAGGLTATVLAVGVAAIVIGVAVSDTGGGDDPAPPVTVQAE